MTDMIVLVRSIVLTSLATWTSIGAAACLKNDPLYCDEETPCTDPDRPYCDLRGEFPASEGHGKTCIATPFDAGVMHDGGLDAGQIRAVRDLAVGTDRSCAVFEDGGVRCWGAAPLGYPAEVGPVGDDESPAEVGDVPTGGEIKQVALGHDFTCFLYSAGNVRCVGSNSIGQLGYGHEEAVSPRPDEVADVSLGEPAKSLAAGFSHTCAVLESGAVRCWGQSPFGGAALGYGDGEGKVGDDEIPSDNPTVEVGSAVEAITAGTFYTCALLGGADGRIRCWGYNPSGQLGYGNEDTIGDNEDPSAAGDVDVGGEVLELQSYGLATCALLDGGDVRCWGEGSSVLGYGNMQTWGRDEEAKYAPTVTLGGVAIAIAGGPKCATMSDDSLRCWGTNEYGQLGLGHMETIGDSEDPVEEDPIAIDGRVLKVARGVSEHHACALIEGGAVRCWGKNESGQLGLGHQENLGDNEALLDSPPVQLD